MIEEINIYYVILILLGVCGFLVSHYIQRKKSSGEKMLCNIIKGCDRVTDSEYSRFLGIPLELLGMVYYGLVVLSYIIFSLFPESSGVQLTFWVLGITSGAFLFSVYLTFIQVVVLKDWCQWCLVSAVISLLIFVVAFLSIPSGIQTFLVEVEASTLVALGFALAIGVGGSTITNIMFFKFLKDFKISAEEFDVLKVLTQVTLVALLVVIIATTTLYFTDVQMIDSVTLLITINFVMVVAVVELILNFWIGPNLVDISFDKKHKQLPSNLSRVRRLAFALGAISLVSWFALLVFNTLRDINFDLYVVISAYSFFVICAVIISQLIDQSFSQKSH